MFELFFQVPFLKNNSIINKLISCNYNMKKQENVLKKLMVISSNHL